jgi:Zn finger protein HypA/HybF involved in hydrogenase expression
MANERLIDANALLEKIQFRRPIIDTETKIVSDCVRIARETIVNAPTVDAVEVVHGEWLAEKDEYEICATDFTCSNCKETFCSSEYSDEDFLALMKYCPNCGAKMDGGNEDG